MEKLLDINKTLDLVKLKFYNEWLYTAHIYDEGDSGLHSSLTKQVVSAYIDPLKLPKDAVILDMGAGPGYFLDEMKERGYTKCIGVGLSTKDNEIARSKGHVIKEYDFTFIPQQEGWYDESVDFIFARHSLEHSPYPIFTLMEYNRLLKQFGKMYIELPAPGAQRKFEYNLNHYSVLGEDMIVALLERTGFKIDFFNIMEFDAEVNVSEDKREQIKEKYFSIMVTKQKPLDIK
jgi:SAM-dependent methyltransferase